VNEYIGRAGWGFLVLLVVVVPWGAYRSARALERRALPPRTSFLLSLVLQQAALAWLALWVATREFIVIEWRVGHPARDAAIGLLLTAAMVLAARPLWREAVRRRERRAYLTMPRTPLERAVWVVVSLAAGVGEEVAYRAVLFALLLRITGGAIPAALAAAVFFGLAHLVQGWKSVVIVAGAALVLQGLVWVTGGLAVAIAVHAVYDVIAGIAYGRYGERFDYPIDGIPPVMDAVHA